MACYLRVPQSGKKNGRFAVGSMKDQLKGEEH